MRRTVERVRGRVQAMSITLDDPGHVMRVDKDGGIMDMSLSPS